MATPRNFSRDRGTRESIFSVNTDITYSTVFSEGDDDNFSYETRYHDILNPVSFDRQPRQEEVQQQQDPASLRHRTRGRRASIALWPPPSCPSRALAEQEYLSEESIEEPEAYYLSYPGRVPGNPHEQDIMATHPQSPSQNEMDLSYESQVQENQREAQHFHTHQQSNSAAHPQSPSWNEDELAYESQAQEQQDEQEFLDAHQQSNSWSVGDDQEVERSESLDRTGSGHRGGSTIFFDTARDPATSEVQVLDTLHRNDLHRAHALLVLDGKDEQRPEGVIDLRKLPKDFFCDGDQRIKQWLAPEGQRIVLPKEEDDDLWKFSPKNSSSSSSPHVQLVLQDRAQAVNRLSTYSEHTIDLDEADPQLAATTNQPSSPLPVEDLTGPVPITPPLEVKKASKTIADPGTRKWTEEDLLENVDIYDLSTNPDGQRAKPLRAKRGNEQFHPEYLRQQDDTVNFRAAVVETFPEWLERSNVVRATARGERGHTAAPNRRVEDPIAFSEAEAARSFPTSQPFATHTSRSRTGAEPALNRGTGFQTGASRYRQPTVEDEVEEPADSNRSMGARPQRYQREPYAGHEQRTVHPQARSQRTQRVHHGQPQPMEMQAPVRPAVYRQNPRPMVNTRLRDYAHPSPPLPTGGEVPFNVLRDGAFTSARFPRPAGWVETHPRPRENRSEFRAHETLLREGQVESAPSEASMNYSSRTRATHHQPVSQVPTRSDEIEPNPYLPPSQRAADLKRRTRELREQNEQGVRLNEVEGGQVSENRLDETRRLPAGYVPLLPEEHRQRTPVIPFPDYIHPPTILSPTILSPTSPPDDDGRRSRNGGRTRKGSAKEVLKSLKFWK